MIHLRVLGRATVERDGSVVRGRAVQSHHLALMALLAVSPGRSASRDKLIGHLWPDSETARARHRLSVALHAIRRGLGKEAILTSGEAVTLNPAVVRSDVGDFLDALEAGRLEEAVRVCSGPFLDAFYLKDGADFEKWAETERNRLAGLCRSALLRLAEEAEARGDLRSTVEWRRRLAAQSPYESSLAMALMEALAAAGDIGGAIAHARSFVTRVEADLGIPPNPSVVDLADRLSEQARDRKVETEPGVPEPHRDLHLLSAEDTTEPSSEGITALESPPEQTGRSRGQLVTLAAGGLMAAAAVWTLATSGAEVGGPGPGSASVVVFPFTDLGTEPVGEALADAVGATLAIVPNLMVTDTDSLELVAEDPRWRRVARGLGSSHAITGSVLAESGRARVIAQLREVGTGETVVEVEHARGLSGTDALVEALSMAVADDLRTRIARYVPHHYTDSESANDAFLTAVYEHKRFTEQRIWVALQHYRRGWEEDPSFALSHAIAGSAYMSLSQNFGLAPEIGWERGREHVMRAIAIDPTLPEAYSVLGRLQVFRDRDYEAAEATLRRAIMLYPTHPDARTWYAFYQLYALRDFEGAIANMRRSLEFDPLTAPRSNDVATALYQARRFEEVLEQTRHTWTLDPDMAPSLGPYRAAHAYRELGRYEEAIAEYRAVHGWRGGPSPTGLGITYARMGRIADARAVLREHEDRAGPEGPRGVPVAQLYASVGETDRAMDLLEQRYEANPSSLLHLSTNPGFDPLRSEPRFKALMERMGFGSS